jgi:exopolysaccharide biosynthesis protein
LAQSSNNKILIIITSPITLLEAANILKNSPRIFGVDNIIMALNLDGGLSTGMYIRSKETQFYSAEKKQVKTFLLFE